MGIHILVKLYFTFIFIFIQLSVILFVLRFSKVIKDRDENSVKLTAGRKEILKHLQKEKQFIKYFTVVNAVVLQIISMYIIF